MDNIFREEYQIIYVYVLRETIEDPEEQNKVETQVGSGIPLKAMVSDLFPEKILWKMPGIKSQRAKEIIIEANKVPLIRLSNKIVIDGHDYVGYKDSVGGDLQIMNLDGTYVKLYVYSK